MNNAYAKNAYMNNQVNTAPQNKLIVMLYDGAIRNLKLTELLLDEEKYSIEEVNNALVKAQNIIFELMATLNREAGGEVADNLYSLYDFMYNKLVRANIDKDKEAVTLVRSYMEELRESWASI